MRLSHSTPMTETLSWCARIAAEWLTIAALLYAANLTDNRCCGGMIAIMLGTRQHALGIIGHWAMHGLLPRWMMWACFVPIAVDPDTYRRSHALHHAHLGSPGLDPEVTVVRKYRERWERLRAIDFAADALYLHLDEAIDIMRMLTSVRAVALYLGFVAVLFAVFGWQRCYGLLAWAGC